jgi:hypothetical protein
MTREEFAALPAPIALGLLYDIAAARLASVEAPQVPRAPKFDSRVSRKGGMFTWASEMLCADLEFWRKRNADASSDPKYAEKNAKQAKALSYWVAYRTACPSDVWTGERDRQKVRAEPPSREPRLHAWESRGAPASESSQTSGGGFADADYAGDDEDIPF